MIIENQKLPYDKNTQTNQQMLVIELKTFLSYWNCRCLSELQIESYYEY
jgi:hypothetical protein